MNKSALGWRFAPPYIALFIFLGLFVPYWPLWLQSRGLNATEIGILVAFTQVIKIITPPLIAERAEAHNRRRMFLIVVGGLSALTFAGFGVSYSFAALAVVTVANHMVAHAYLPLTEQFAVQAARRGRARYGPVRALGSMAFIAASLVGGVAVDAWGAEAFFWLALGATCLLPLAGLFLPRDQAPVAAHAVRRLSLAPMLSLLRRADIRRLFLVAALLQSSHGVYYALGSLHWQKLGLSGTVIGILWGIGVAVEIIYLVFAGRRLHSANPWRVFMVVGVLGALRWTVTAFTGDVYILMAVQCLHAATYGATHLAVISYLAHHVPDDKSSSAQALYSALPMGLGMAITVGAAGVLYQGLGGHTYLVMAVLCLSAIWFCRGGDGSGVRVGQGLGQGVKGQ